MGTGIDVVTKEGAVKAMMDAVMADRGCWAITANLDHLRRYTVEPLVKELIDAADLVVADGTPVVWASRLAGTPLPERVAGSDIIWSICEAAARGGKSVFLVGGNPGVADRAAEVLRERYADLTIAGVSCPPVGFEKDEQIMESLQRELMLAEPQVVLVALGFPKQDLVIRRLRHALPQASFMGVGISLSFVSGEVSRAPEWIRKLGLEWLYRLLCEPRRLARRYLLQGVPFGIKLLVAASWRRMRSDASGEWGWAER